MFRSFKVIPESYLSRRIWFAHVFCLFALFISSNSVSTAQNNAAFFEAPFISPSGTFEWDVFSGSTVHPFTPDVTNTGGDASLSLTFTPDVDNGPPFPLVSSTSNIYAAGSFPDYTASLSNLVNNGIYTTVVLQVAAVGDAFSGFQLNDEAPIEFVNRGIVPSLGHGNGDAEFDTTFYWAEWQLDGTGPDGDDLSGFDLTFSSIPHVSLAGLRVDYVNSISVVDATPGSTLSLKGDFDNDGDVDVDDLDQYIGAIGTDTNDQQSALDLTVDGIIDLDDFEQHYSQLVQTSNGQVGTFQGDINLDGVVNVLGDAFALVGSLGNSVSSWSEGDLNADGQVTVLGDAFALVGNLGNDNSAGSAAPSAVAVPEPSSALMVLFSAGLLGMRRHKSLIPQKQD